MFMHIYRRRQRHKVHMRRRRGPDEDEEEPDPDESELRNFERHCMLLDSKQFEGRQLWQVRTWLLFEDGSSSIAASVRACAAIDSCKTGWKPKYSPVSGCSRRECSVG